MMNSVRDYQNDRSKFVGGQMNDALFFLSIDKIKDFLNEFEIDTEDGYKASKYLKQIVEKIPMEISDSIPIEFFVEKFSES